MIKQLQFTISKRKCKILLINKGSKWYDYISFRFEVIKPRKKLSCFSTTKKYVGSGKKSGFTVLVLA